VDWQKSDQDFNFDLKVLSVQRRSGIQRLRGGIQQRNSYRIRFEQQTASKSDLRNIFAMSDDDSEDGLFGGNAESGEPHPQCALRAALISYIYYQRAQLSSLIKEAEQKAEQNQKRQRAEQQSSRAEAKRAEKPI
jgi:hypothetical protein